MTAPTPEQLGQLAAQGAADLGAHLAALQARIAIALGVPAWPVVLEPPPPPTRRQLIARHVGQAGWRLGHTVAQAGGVLARAGHRLTAAGHRLQRDGDRVIDGGDWLAERVAGR